MQYKATSRIQAGVLGVLLGLGVFMSAAASAQMTVFESTLGSVPGHTPGEFSVTPSGAATYSIPIQVPPGVAGLVPNLSLNYSSQADLGIAGLGWSLNGSSAVTRCPATRATDGTYGSVNLNTADRFCLDGQRLIVISGAYGAAGSEYRTEMDQFSRITANGAVGGNAANGPESFTVRTKDGRVLQLGATADSRIEAQGKTVVSVWALSSISDVKGNAISFAYTEDGANGDWRLGAVGYGDRSVHLIYETRPDIYRNYRAGSLESSTARLKQVETRIGSTAIQRTNLTYDTASNLYSSRLVSVQLCDAANLCLAPTRFGWGAIGSDAYSSAFAASHGGGKDNNITADFDGDGRSDMAGFTGSGASWHVCLSAGTSAAPTFNCSLWSGTTVGVKGVVSGDYNGDGRTDIAGYTGTANKWAVCLSTGSNFSCSNWYSHSGGVGQNVGGDFNGDGRTDMAFHAGNGVWSVCLSTGAAFSCSNWNSHNGGYANNMTADFNGDGLADMLSYTSGTTWRLCLSTASGFGCSNVTAHAGGIGKSTIGDFNGDGLKDLAGYLGTPGSGTSPWKICLSTGTGFVCSDWTGPNTELANVALGDYNGDGRTDLAAYNFSLGQWKNFLSTGTSFSAGTMWSGASHNEAQGDYNGDGINDFAAYTGANGQWRLSYSLKNERPLVQTITRGSVVTGIEFQGMSAPGQAVYTKEASSTYPLMDIQTPMNLVRRVTVSNGVGGTNASRYHYGAMRAEHAGAVGQGRGNQGFRWSRMIDEATQIEGHTWYAQDWPYTGQLIKSETRLSGKGNGGLLKRVETSFDCHQTVAPSPTTPCTTTSPPKLYHVFPKKTTESNWDLYGVTMPVIETTRTLAGSPLVDGNTVQLGDITSLEVMVRLGGVDKQRKVTANEYHPAKTTGADWQIGRLKKATVTSSSFETPPATFGYIPLVGGAPSSTGVLLTTEQAAVFVPILQGLLLDEN